MGGKTIASVRMRRLWSLMIVPPTLLFPFHILSALFYQVALKYYGTGPLTHPHVPGLSPPNVVHSHREAIAGW